jgi:hypothetical protein
LRSAMLLPFINHHLLRSSFLLLSFLFLFSLPQPASYTSFFISFFLFFLLFFHLLLSFLLFPHSSFLSSLISLFYFLRRERQRRGTGLRCGDALG